MSTEPEHRLDRHRPDQNQDGQVEVWELRIHGVSNTPPESILRTRGDADPVTGEPREIRRVAGDETTGFYRYSSPRPGDPRFVVEAFSWGQLTSGRRVTGAGAAKDLRRAGWSVLLPFALVNVALWARPRVDPDLEDDGRSAVLAFGVRLLALTLTVTLVLAAGGVAMDLVAWQCRSQCSRTVPGTGWLDSPELLEGARLAAVGAVLPLALIAAIWWLAGKTFQYEAAVPVEPSGSDTPAAPASSATPTTAVTGAASPLEHPLFWSGEQQVRALRSLHVGVALAAVAHLLAAAVWGGTDPADRPLALAVLADAVVLLVVVMACRCLLRTPVARRTEPDAPMPSVPAWTVRLGMLALGLGLVAALWPGPSGGAAMPGFEDAVRLVYLLQFVLLSGLGVLASVEARDVARQAGAAAGEADAPAWRGLGTLLFAGAGWAMGLLYSAALFFGVSWWLNGGAGGDREAAVAATMQWSAIGLVLAAVALAVGAILGWRTLAARRASEQTRLVERLLRSTPHRRAHARTAGSWRGLHRFTGYDAFSQIGWLAVVVAVLSAFGALIAGLGLVTATGAPGIDVGLVREAWQERVATVLDVLSTAGALLAVGMLFGLSALVGAAYRRPQVRRVLGIVWDVVTFWPRGAHPFAPPCYAERAVPQLVTRISGSCEQRTIVAAHSQGVLLAAATVMQLPASRRQGVYLLTFGTQITRFYGRAFPALFGRAGRGRLATLMGAPALAAETPAWERARWRSLYRPTDPLGWPVGSTPHPWDPDEAEADDPALRPVGVPPPGSRAGVGAGGGAGGAAGEGVEPVNPRSAFGAAIDVYVRDPEGYEPTGGEVLDPAVRQHSDYPASQQYVAVREQARAVLAAASPLDPPAPERG